VNQSYDDSNGGTYSVGGENNQSLAVTFDSANPGRATFSPSSSSTVYLYMFNTNSALVMDASTTSGEPNAAGWFDSQTQTTFTDAAVAGDYMIGGLPPLAPPAKDVTGEVDLLSNGNLTSDITTAGEGTYTFDQSGSGTYSWDTTAPGTGSFLLGSGSSGQSCIVISSTKAACIVNTDTAASVPIMQQ
jgi:hypothetical protein